MKLTLTDVSKQQLRKTGFLCSSVVINKDMILLFKMDKDVVLDNHNHPHAQLGYCFNSDFGFEGEGDHIAILMDWTFRCICFFWRWQRGKWKQYAIV